MNAEEWISEFVAAAGGEAPSSTEVEQILKLAAVAAHSSERMAAPVACWIAGRLGLELEQARKMAETIN